MQDHSVNELMDLFLQTNDLAQLIEKAAQVLKNPIVVCDTSYHFLCRSNVQGVRDKSWLTGMKRGGWTQELVSIVNSLDLDYSGQEHKTQILDNINASSSSRRMIGTLCMDRTHLGYYLILEENVSFDSICAQTYQQVASILAKSICTDRSLHLPGGERSSEGLMLDLLQSGFDSRALFLERAGKSDLARTGTYRVFCIPMPQGRNGAEGRMIRSGIGHCLPLSWQIHFQDNMVILADFSSKIYQRPDIPDIFHVFLTQHSLYAGYSDTFSDPYQLKRYFEQARAAVYLGQAFQDRRCLIPYEEYKLYTMFRNVRDEDLFAQYSTEAVRRVYEYDRNHATEYLDTLYHYLSNQCSVQKAAEKLYVHRNTVAYRMTRIRELFAIDFDNGYKNHMNLISCLLRRYCDQAAARDE